MCGIAGVFLKKPDKRIIKKVSKMEKGLSHRGPDSSGFYSNKLIKLIHTRLSIVDLTGGSQPIENENYVLIANGEIYNDPEIRKKIKKYSFKSKSDSESIIAVYSEFGISGFEKLRGMYAFALYDKKKKILILNRDIFGIKPLYFSIIENGIIFSSEIGALKETNFENLDVCRNKLAETLQLQYSSGKNTIYKKIQRLRPGELIILEEGRIKKSLINKLFKENKTPTKINDKYIYEAILESVSTHLRSDVPYCLFFSGGIDSMLIMYFMNIINSKNRNTAYKISIEGQGENKKSPINEISKEFNFDFNEIFFSKKDFWELLPFAAKNIDEPIADYAIIPTFKLASEASKKYKVALTGEGGDELFGGYGRYKSKMRFLKRKYYKGAFDNLKSFRKCDWDFEISQFKYKYNYLSSLQRFQAFDYENWLPNDLLVKLDRCLMTFGMEGRTPLVDKELFKKIFYIKDKEKTNRGLGKYFVRKFLSSRIKKYNSFSRKEGFTIPISEWISDKSKILEELLPKVEILHEFIKSEDIRNLCKNVEYNKKLARPLWNIIFISIWYCMNEKNTKANGNFFEIISENF